MRIVQLVMAALAVLVFAAPNAAAAADEAVLHKGDFWTVGRGEPDSEICFASVPTKGATCSSCARSGDRSASP